MKSLQFTPRDELSEFERATRDKWQRPDVDAKELKALCERSTLRGFLKLGYFVLLLALAAGGTMWAASYSWWLAIPCLYAYYFLYGFWVAVAHELQHRMVFARSWQRFSDGLSFVVHTLLWNSPRYARISHQLHHRYTMVRGVDPETDWPEVIDSRWLRGLMTREMLSMLVVGAIPVLFKDVWVQIRRVLGIKDRMMQDHCTDEDIRVIRIESAAILVIHLAVVAAAIVFRRWEPVALMTLAWQVGSPFERLWHNTEHIGRLYDVNDQRLATRSVRVNPFIKSIYWGLDDHVDHHDFPSVPARNLPQLHQLLHDELPEPRAMVDCWKEMFAIAREKDERPRNEHVPDPPGVRSLRA